MATKPRAELSAEALELVADRFRVLAEPVRLQILQLLRAGEKNVSELTALLDTTQPNVSKHLRVLQEAGLAGRRQEGNNVYYSVADESVFALVSEVVDRLHAQMAERAKVLGRRR
jgi:DNA-binding transcriptional ArsR family regulator